MQVKSLYQLTKKLGSVNFLCALLDLGVNNTIDILVYCLIRLEKKGFEEDITVDIIATQKRILKMCRKYTLEDVTVRRALERLDKAGLIKIIYKLAFQKRVVHLLPFPGLEDQDDDSSTDVSDVVVEQNPDTKSDADNSTQKKRVEHQQLIYASRKARSQNIHFGTRGLKIIARYSRDILDLVFNHYAAVKDRTHIPSPTGWIINNLRQKWYLSFKPEKEVKSKQQKLFELQDWFVDNFGSLPQRFEQLDLFRQKKYEPRTV